MTNPADRPVAATTPTSNPVLRRALKYGLLVAAAIAVVGSILGWMTAGEVGVISALIGTGIAAVFLAITALSILVANRFSGSDIFVGAFFGIVLGGWLVKFIVFFVLLVLLKDQPWINNMVMFLSIVAAVLGSLVVDVVVMLKSRIPYVSDAKLPGDDDN